MLPVALGGADRPVRQILALGAHPDDIEIGCGGAILKIIERYQPRSVVWVVFSGSRERADEARSSAKAFLEGVEEQRVDVKGFRDGFFPGSSDAIKEIFEELKGAVAPDVIFTHRRQDAHQDHRLIGELTWNTFRDHLILEYEIPKYEGDLGAPNLFVPLDRSTAARKIELLLKGFPSQHSRTWFDADLFWAVLRLRGLEASSPTRYAEGFYCRKTVVS